MYVSEDECVGWMGYGVGVCVGGVGCGGVCVCV